METEIYKCKQCAKEFNYKNGLLRHQKLTHAKEKKYECNICRRRFGYKNILLEHQNIHFGIKPYACSICDKRFAARSNLVQHRIVHKRPLSCNVCPQRFQSDEALQRHLKGHHATMLSCNLCAFSTPNQIVLNEHIHTSHATELNKPKTSSQSQYSKNRLRRRSSSIQQAFNPETVSIYQQELLLSSTADDAVCRSGDSGYPVGIDPDNIIVKREPLSPGSEMYIQHSTFTEPEIRHGNAAVVSLSDTHSAADDRVSTPRSYSSQSREAGIADSTSGIADVLSKLHTCIKSSMDSPTRTTPRYSINVEPPKSMCDFGSQFTSERSDMPSIREVMAYLEAKGQVFRCIHCCIMFEDRGLYILHNSLHGADNPWRCTVCNKVCLNKNDFHLHLANQQHG